MRRAALLVRFPTVRTLVQSYPIIDGQDALRYPELATDIAAADEVVLAAFAESDREALSEQNRYRRQQVIVILGTALLSGCGGLQAIYPGQRWPGILLVLLGLVLAFVGRVAGELGTLESFLDERVKAERLRSAYFRYLSRTGRYIGPDRTIVLRRTVVAIKKGEEPV